MSKDNQVLDEITSKEYEHGWAVNLEADEAPKGLTEDTVRFISAKKNEPAWLLDWRLEAYRKWVKLKEPEWANIHHPPIDYQEIIYYSAPKQKAKLNSIDEVDPELIKTFEKLGISLTEQKRLTGVAVDAVIDSVSVATTFKEKLGELGIIFCSFSEAVREHPELIKKYLGSVVPMNDNYFAALNSAVFSESLTGLFLTSICLVGDDRHRPVHRLWLIPFTHSVASWGRAAPGQHGLCRCAHSSN